MSRSGARHRALFAGLFGLVGLIAMGCEPAPPTVTAPTESPLPSPAVFADQATASGIDFEHFPGDLGDYFFPEIMGSGVALLDYDIDGDLDVYAIQGAVLDAGSKRSAGAESGAIERPVNRLFRNDTGPDGAPRFTDVTAASGLGDAGYGMGVAVGDTDNDGDPDIFLANFGRNRFFENNGDGSFRLLSGAMAVDEERWTTSASFADFDRDGDLDLFATNYVAFSLDHNIDCPNNSGQRDYCSPKVFPPTTDRLWRNDGNNVFVDVSVESGIAALAGNGLGVVASDLDTDGDIDFYVANDLLANRLWLQDADGRFADAALMAGAAFNADGSVEASMGVSAADFDGDGDEDLFMTHLNRQTNTLYENVGNGEFVDRTDIAGVGTASLMWTGFGTAWLDYDNDGWLDLYVANGAVGKHGSERGDPEFPFGEANQLFRNEAGRFRDVSRNAGAANALKETSRGAAFGDVDNDGDVDIAVSNGKGPIRLLINQVGNQNNWLRVQLEGRESNRDGAGARVVLMRTDGSSLWRRAHTDGSYLSASDIRVHFGVGRDALIEAVGVVWPSGRREQWRGVAVNQQIVLAEGEGEAWIE